MDKQAIATWYDESSPLYRYFWYLNSDSFALHYGSSDCHCSGSSYSTLQFYCWMQIWNCTIWSSASGSRRIWHYVRWKV